MNTQHSYAKEKTAKHWEVFNFPAESKMVENTKHMESFLQNSYLIYQHTFSLPNYQNKVTF